MGILDFGLVGYLTERELMMMNETIFAVYLGKPKRTVKTTLRMCGDYEFPTERKKRAFAADIQKFVRRAPHEPFGFWLTESSRLLTKHGVPVPPVLAIIGRFGIVGDGVVQTFFPHSSTAELIGDDMEAGIFQQMLRKTFKKGSWLLLLDALAERAERAPKDAADFVRDPLKTVADAVEAVIKPFKKAA